MREILLGASSLCLGIIASAAVAQTNPTVRIRGTIEKVDGNVLSIHSRDGQNVTVKLDDNFSATVVVKASLDDIKSNTFVGTAAVPLPDGTMKALEVHIFPEAMRGVGEGFRDFDLQPKSTMTNAAVTGIVNSADGRVLTLTYKDGEKKVVVPTNAPIVTFEPGTKEDVKPGIGIIVFGAEKLPDDTLRAKRITIGRNGTNPPM
jgi:hypothetical protein